MRTFKRICIENYVLEAQNGDRLELKRGKEYTTSVEHCDGSGTVTVFSTFWERVPASIFAGAILFTAGEYEHVEDAR